MERGLKAQVHDSLWFLSRQWSLGEFKARNGGQLVSVDLKSKCQDITEIGLSGSSCSKVPQDAKRCPLEPFIEEAIDLDASGTKTARPEAWKSNRFEYQFFIKSGETKLEVKEFWGESLDWYDFSIAGGLSVDAECIDKKLQPSLVQFPGMPNPRWWQFEDNRIDLGAIDRPYLNFLSMLLIEFSVVFSNDWYVIPLVQPVGTLRVINDGDLVVKDTFGFEEKIEPIKHDKDAQNQWNMFTLSSSSDQIPGSELFFLPSTIVKELKSKSIEEVSIFRDELANLTWAVEHRHSEGAQVVDLDDFYLKSEQAQSIGSPNACNQYPQFKLRSNLPANWIPYIPVKVKRAVTESSSDHIVFRRARTNPMIKTRQCKGVLLNESVTVNEEEVPSSTPLLLSRACKLIHYGKEKWNLDSINGQYQLRREPNSVKRKVWIAREKKPGSRRGYSKLRFDYLIENGQTERK